MIFYWETNIYRDIPIYKVLQIFFIGGTLSLIFTLLLHIVTPSGPDYFAPLTEEPAKILAAAVFINMLGVRRISGGLLVGAAVGAGFAVFETVQYIINHMVTGAIFAALVESAPFIMSNPEVFKVLAVYSSNPAAVQESTEAMTIVNMAKKIVQEYVFNMNLSYSTMNAAAFNVFFSRSLLSLGGHVTWCAIEGGALAMVKGNESLSFKHFTDTRFIGYALICMLFSRAAVTNSFLDKIKAHSKDLIQPHKELGNRVSAETLMSRLNIIVH